MSNTGGSHDRTQDSLVELIRRQREYGDMVTDRQRQAAARRRAAEDQPFQYIWEDPDFWTTPEGRYPIRRMADSHLWQTVNWLARNLVPLFEQSAAAPTPANMSPALAAAYWLRDRVTFRAMVRESVRRDFTFPPDVFRYLKTYVVDRGGDLTEYQPWHDPASQDQVDELKAFEKQSLRPPRDEFGKDLRSIEI